MDAAALEQLVRSDEQHYREKHDGLQRTEAAGLRLPVHPCQLERAPACVPRAHSFKGDQRYDEERREAPGDLGGRADPTAAPLQEAERQRDAERVAGPPGDAAES